MLDTHKEMNHIKMDTQKKKKKGENMNYSYINKYIMGGIFTRKREQV